MSELPEDDNSERRRDPLRRFWTRDAMRELAETGELGEPPSDDGPADYAGADSDGAGTEAAPPPRA